MKTAEKIVFSLRHSRYLGRANWLWDCVRPIYDRVSAQVGRNGLERVMNGSDKILLSPRWRMVSEEYEPAVWHHLMGEVTPGDVIVDVGAHIGIYTVALAKRVGSSGKIIAFEPDPLNVLALKTHINLNSLGDRVKVVQAAAGAHIGEVGFTSNMSESHVSTLSLAEPNGAGSHSVRCVTLDSVFANQRVDLIKIDVEGYEEKVIEGATDLLKDAGRGPRSIFIEVHPYAWPALNTTSESLLSLLRNCNFDVYDLAGKRVERIEEYGEVIAHRLPA